MILRFLRKDTHQETAAALYAAAVEQARLPEFYEKFGASDTVEGRFEMVALHVYLILRRLKGNEPGAKEAGQRLFDVMFEDMDGTLRELGVGDLSVGKRIRRLAENFFGRIAAYEEAIKDCPDEPALALALGRNIYSDETSPQSAKMAAYVVRAAAHIESQPVARIIGGIVQFPDPVETI